jgi:hypothetical protein
MSAIETLQAWELRTAVGALSVDFAALYERHRDVVYRLALRYAAGRNARTAEPKR